MYFEGNITIDPEGVSQIEKVKPTKAFKRMLHFLTLGGVSDKLERQTFTALSILQQINVVLAKNNIDDIVRLSHDEFDFYLDLEGKRNDLKEAMDKYDLEINEAMSAHFEKLVMVLEADDEHFKYLLQVNINRTHEVGDHPIEIKISGLLKDFSLNAVSQSEMKARIGEVASSTEAMESYRQARLLQFEGFINTLKHSVKTLMKVDEVSAEVKTKLVVTDEKVATAQEMKYRREKGYHGIYHGYYGFDDFLFYSMLWASVCHDHNVVINDIHLESAAGAEIGHYDEIDTSADSFDENTEFNAAEFDSDLRGADADVDADSTSSWFGGVFDGGDWSDSGGSSCSSCSSCGGD